VTDCNNALWKPENKIESLNVCVTHAEHPHACYGNTGSNHDVAGSGTYRVFHDLWTLLQEMIS